MPDGDQPVDGGEIDGGDEIGHPSTSCPSLPAVPSAACPSPGIDADDLPAVNLHDPVDPPLEQRLVLLREDERAALEIELPERGVEAGGDAGREPERRLVDQEDAGVGHEASPERAHAPLAAGERAGGLAEPVREPREQPQDPFAAPLALAPAGGERARVEVVPDREAREERVALRDEHDPRPCELVRRRPHDRLAVELDLARGASRRGP